MNVSSIAHFWDSHRPFDGRLSSLSFKDSWTIEITNNGDEKVFLDHVNFKLGSRSTLRCLPVCGNGILEEDELCDDTTDRASSGCLDDCSGPLETHFCKTIGSKLSSHCINQRRMLANTCGNNIVEPGEECDNVFLTLNDTRVCIPVYNTTNGGSDGCKWWDTGKTSRTPYSTGTSLYGYANYSSCQSIIGYPTYCDFCGDGKLGPLEECEHDNYDYPSSTNSAWPTNIDYLSGCTIQC